MAKQSQKHLLADRHCVKNNEYYIQIVGVPLRHAHTQCGHRGGHRGDTEGHRM